MNKQKRYKQIATGVVLLVALIIGLSQMEFQSVDSYQKEQQQISKELGLDGGVEEASTETGKVSLDDGTESTNSTEDTVLENSASDDSVSEDSKEGEEKDKLKKNSKNKNKEKKDGSYGDKNPSEQENSSKEGKKHSSKNADASSKDDSGKKKNGKNHSKKPTQNDSSQADAGTDSQPAASDGGSSSQEQIVTPVPSKSPADSEKDNSKDSGSTKVTPVPTKEPEKEKITCTVQIVCHTLLDNKEDADSSIWKYIPSNGVLLAETTITVEEGTTAYEALSQVCKAKNIALDSEYTPMYKNYYVKGIGHLYEKQAGNRSGWVYKINGKSTNKGASSFVLSEGDNITWTYTCDGKTS